MVEICVWRQNGMSAEEDALFQSWDPRRIYGSIE